MNTQTYIISKDAALEDTITNLQQSLLEAGFNIVEQTCLNPIVNVWSVQIRDSNCPLLLSNGRGTSKKAALANALGKFVERLSNHYFWINCYLGDEISNSKFVHYPNERWFKTNDNDSWPAGVLNQELQVFYNPEDELNVSKLIDSNSANPKRGICCLPFESVGTREIVNFPVNIINNLYSSNGMAAGDTFDEAHVQALSEILQRFVKFKIIAEGISLPNIPSEVLNRYPSIQTSIQAIENAAYPLLVQDASLGGNYPVIAVTLLNSQDQGVTTAFGAHPIFEVALENALTKLLQGRSLDQLQNFAEAGFDMDEIASPQNLEAHFKDSSGIVAWSFLKDTPDYEFIDWGNQQSSSDTAEQFNQLCEIIQAKGNDIFISDKKLLGVNTCRILVPGMSEIYPLDDLIWENNNAGITIRDSILKQSKTLTECEQLIEDLEDLNLDDHYLVSELISMPSDEDSIFKDLSIAELITLLALKTQDNERIQEGCEWLQHFKQLNPKRLKTYQCINTILQLNGMKNYANTLEKLYTRAILNDALALIDGEDIFPLVSDWKMYGLLIESYKKIININ
ncbi:UNVERIFIED_CONTAM: hypothetical protein GTU68_065245 [Idotea baltica]|nr:hypothetical protein [Idotea baltica]